MKELLFKAAEYLRYPSTYKGLAVLLSLAGISLAPAQAEAITILGGALFGIISVFFSDADVKPK